MGGEALIVETLVFDEGQITCPTNGLNPQWGAVPFPIRERREDGSNYQNGGRMENEKFLSASGGAKRHRL